MEGGQGVNNVEKDYPNISQRRLEDECLRKRALA